MNTEMSECYCDQMEGIFTGLCDTCKQELDVRRKELHEIYRKVIQAEKQ